LLAGIVLANDPRTIGESSNTIKSSCQNRVGTIEVIEKIVLFSIPCWPWNLRGEAEDRPKQRCERGVMFVRCISGQAGADEAQQLTVVVKHGAPAHGVVEATIHVEAWMRRLNAIASPRKDLDHLADGGMSCRVDRHAEAIACRGTRITETHDSVPLLGRCEAKTGEERGDPRRITA
jgi:hypothetical protein